MINEETANTTTQHSDFSQICARFYFYKAVAVMSFTSEIENWNPMAEDFEKFTSYEDISPLHDPYSLYLKSVPAELTEDVFRSIMSEGGKKIRNIYIFPTKPDFSVTCGLVSYENAQDASEMKAKWHLKPPLNMRIEYALKNDKKSSQNIKFSHSSLEEKNECTFAGKGRGQKFILNNSHNAMVGRNVSRGSFVHHTVMGRGRNQPVVSDHFPTPLKSKSIIQQSVESNFTLPANKGLEHSDGVHALKVVLEGNRRTAYQKPATVETEFDDVPGLIPNPFLLCLFCKKKGELSCKRCHQPYCTVKCQRSDWPKHKLICQPFPPAASVSRQLTNDSSYMSEGSSCSDNEKKFESRSQNQFTYTKPSSLSSEVLFNKFKNLQASFKQPQKEITNVKENQKKSIKINEIRKTLLSLNKEYEIIVSNRCHPSNFWIQLNESKKILSQMEKEMATATMERQTVVTCTVDDVCFTVKNKKFMRVQIIESKSSSSIVQFIDYGEISTVQNDQLYYLPQLFKKYPAQAVCCNLVGNDSGANIAWTDHDISSFQALTSNKNFTALVVCAFKSQYDVQLWCKDNGSCLFSLLTLPNFIEKQEDFESKDSKMKIPSVWDDLKEGAEVTVMAVEFKENKFWGLLDNGSNCALAIGELENLLQTVETEDISLIAEEGDVAVGFSPKFNQYYRCVILKRLRSSFVVRFIDYGNEEEITKIHSLAPTILQKKSFVVCCEKPPFLNLQDFNFIFENSCSLVVKSVKNNVVELSCNHKNKSIYFKSYPWYHDTVIAKQLGFPEPQSITSHLGSGVMKKNAGPHFPKKRISVPEKSLSEPVKNVAKLEHRITKDFISDKKLRNGIKYNVNIVWIKDASEIYVQLKSDDNDLLRLSQGINNYCNSNSCASYVPEINEIICCKFPDDGTWYRAQVMGKNKDIYEVFFIDYGNKSKVSKNDIRPLPEKFAIPKLCTCVALHKIENKQLTPSLVEKLVQETWSMEVRDALNLPLKVMLFQGEKSFAEFLNNKKNHKRSLLKFQKLPLKQTTDVMICYADIEKLYVHQLKDVENLLDLQKQIEKMEKIALTESPEINMVYCCLSSDGCYYRACVLEKSHGTVLINYIDYGNNEEVKYHALKELPDNLFAHPVYCIPVIVQDLNALELKPQGSYKLEVIGLKLNVQLVRILNLPDINIVKYPSASSLKKLSLEKGVNEIQFMFNENGVYYCHLKNQASNFEILSKKLINSVLKPLNQIPAKGDLVCARSSDKCWCRASILSVSTSSYKVLFIDFGNSEDVISEDVKCLPNDLLQFPVFCVPVKVMNLEKAKNVIDLSSMITVKTIDGTSSNMQFVEVVLPKGPNLPKIDTLQKQLMPLDKVDRISICYMQDDIFYVHLLSSREFITMLESELSKGETFDSLINMPEVGDLVCAKFTDGIWYRGTVETVHRNNSCEICFIDYGNNEIITLDNMKILPDSLCSYPVFSIPVKFKNIEKLQSHIEFGMSVFAVKVVALSPEQIPVIDVEPEHNKKLSCIESQALPGSPIEAGVCYVEEDVFYLQKASDAEKLEELTIELQNPISLKSLSHTPTIGELLNIKYQDGQFYRGLVKEKCDNKYKIYFVDYGNTDVVDVTNIYCLPSKYSSWPMLCVAVKFDKSENIESLNVNSLCTVKYTGELINNVQVVRLYNEVTPILFSSLKSSQLEVGVHDVIFTSFDKYFHYLIKTSDFTTMKEINSLLKEFKGEVIRHTPIVNEVLVVKCQNTQWCRGCLKEVNEISKTCNVYLIDFGTTETISFSDILYISDEISAFPVFCTKVSVDFSKSSIDSVSFGDSYSVTVFDVLPENIPVVKIFKPFMLTSLKQQVLPINELRDVMFFHQEGNRFFLQNVCDSSLIRETQAEVKGCSSSEVITHNPIIGELLCAQSKKNGIWYRCCVEEIVSLDMWRIRFVDYGNDEVVSRECLRPFTEELTVYPIFAILVRIIENKCENPKIQFEQLYSVMAESLLEDNVQLVKLLLHHNKHTVPEDEVVEQSCSLAVTSRSSNIVNDKAKESITKYFYSNAEYVSFPIGEHDIIIYHASDECSLFCAPYSMDGISTNLGLCSDITEYCENIKCSSYNSEILPDLDELVLAKYHDEKWYRAVIVDNSCHPFYDVIFVDFGNSEHLHIDSLRKMEKKFMLAEIQSHICTLTGFEMDDEKMPSIVQELKKFTVFINSAPLKAFVSIEGEELLVNIPEITKHLIEKNLVVSSSQ
ncbi:hypothetical protein CDAR_506451 [Caerostris darwini]|uniref:Tudor domain-containing protein 1 n=1 Tax=Caerostris darwini TaxID=1538125 RepID=A0AAV4Q8G7_9ARAC|nr:hypothetical protein CDAR_506451 [Caerostris darwini]